GDTFDAVVIGGGPAGSAAAHLLASWNWSVLHVHHRPSRPSLAESLPGSTRKLLALVGDLVAVDRAGFHPCVGNVARWADAARPTRSDVAGFHVCRDDFDRVLREAAARAGAGIVDGLVRRVDPGDPARATYATPAGELITVHGREVLDCSGRAGIVAARGFRRADAGYRTIAIAAEWESNAWPIEERARTLVESYAHGWAWSVPLWETRRQCTVMIDGGRPAERVALRPMYDRELKKTSLLAGRIEASHAAAVGEPWACDASVYDCQRATDEGVLLVGDA